ncbi:MAG: hypothetical protein IKC03_02390, partial [Oscillospiraceae bacterium]|nr:hypothetical protein [Oscillospiraceae bacterium]
MSKKPNKRRKKNDKVPVWLEKLPEYKYFKKHALCQMLIGACRRDPQMDAFAKTVFEQLASCTVGQMVPDYCTYQQKISLLLQGKPLIMTMDYRTFSGGAMRPKATVQELYLLIGALYHVTMQKIEEKIEGKEECTPQEFEAFSRYKLVLSCFENKERVMSFFDSISDESLSSEENVSEFDDTPSAQKIIHRLKEALRMELESEAYQLIGMLQLQKNELDP